VGIGSSISAIDVSVEISGRSLLTGDISEDNTAECLKFSETSTTPSPLPRSQLPLAALQQLGPPPPPARHIQGFQPSQPIVQSYPLVHPKSRSPRFHYCRWEIFHGIIIDIKRKRMISLSEIYGPSSHEIAVTLSLVFRIKVDIYSRDLFSD
jgi:hypothetical protein